MRLLMQTKKDFRKLFYKKFDVDNVIDHISTGNFLCVNNYTAMISSGDVQFVSSGDYRVTIVKRSGKIKKVFLTMTYKVVSIFGRLAVLFSSNNPATGQSIFFKYLDELSPEVANNVISHLFSLDLISPEGLSIEFIHDDPSTNNETTVWESIYGNKIVVNNIHIDDTNHFIKVDFSRHYSNLAFVNLLVDSKESTLTSCRKLLMLIESYPDYTKPFSNLIINRLSKLDIKDSLQLPIKTEKRVIFSLNHEIEKEGTEIDFHYLEKEDLRGLSEKIRSALLLSEMKNN